MINLRQIPDYLKISALFQEYFDTFPSSSEFALLSKKDKTFLKLLLFLTIGHKEREGVEYIFRKPKEKMK